ncbi:MAG TPA: nitrate- and nitrite sensing domain-containing protein, partial [Acidimicrobiales bacterium]|nr:nitrate- and nitrite sensing domain-containing protein [Acidimicrobiales bacterium]
MSKAGWRVPINVKLLAVLAVPVLGYLVIATTLVARAQQTATEIRDQASVVKTAVGPTSLTTSLIDERTITSLEGAGLQDDLKLRIGSSAEARQATDQQLASLQTLIDDNSQARDEYESAVDKMASELETLRADVDAGTADEASLFSRYGEVINTLMDANAKAVERVDEAELWQGAKLSELATRQKDARAILINALIPVAQNDGAAITPRQTTAIGRSLGAYQNRDAAIRELATGPYAKAGSILVEATEAADLGKLAQETLRTGQLDSAEFFDIASYKGGFVYNIPTGDFIHDNFRASIVEYLTGKADDRTTTADQGLRNHLIAGSIGLVITALITWLVSRSIIRPLRSLTQQAIDTATNRLPSTVYDILETPLGEDVAWPTMEPIKVTTSDEVSDVANALNTMQESALELAVEEAIL